MTFLDVVLETETICAKDHNEQISKRAAKDKLKAEEIETYTLLKDQLDKVLFILSKDGEISVFKQFNPADPVVDYNGQHICVGWQNELGNNLNIQVFPPQMIKFKHFYKEATWLPGIIILNSWNDDDRDGHYASNKIFLLDGDIKVGSLAIKEARSLYDAGILYAPKGEITDSFNEIFSSTEKNLISVGEFLLKTLMPHKTIFSAAHAVAITEALTGVNPVPITKLNEAQHPYNFDI